MIPYSGGHDAPLPILSATLPNIARGRPRVEVLALLDIGSDMTAIPSSFLK